MADSKEGFELETTWEIRIKIHSHLATFCTVWRQAETSLSNSKMCRYLIGASLAISILFSIPQDMKRAEANAPLQHLVSLYSYVTLLGKIVMLSKMAEREM